MFMIKKYDKNQFNIGKNNDSYELECEICHNSFFAKKYEINNVLGTGKNHNHCYTLQYCSKKCQAKSQRTGFTTKCKQCGKEIYRLKSHQKRVKNFFCSKSCQALYYNTHKNTYYGRSKLEKWIELKLTELYPELKIDYNKTNTINAELDIYIPKLLLAFELNGIFHYEPIFGKEYLERRKTNDNRKILACAEKGIELCVIDTSQQKHFKIEKSQKFLNIILKIIRDKIQRIS